MDEIEKQLLAEMLSRIVRRAKGQLILTQGEIAMIGDEIAKFDKERRLAGFYDDFLDYRDEMAAMAEADDNPVPPTPGVPSRHL